MSNSVIPWSSACQASLSIPSSQNLLKLMSIKWVMPANHLILCRPWLLEDIYSFSVYKSRGKEQTIQHTAKLKSKMFPFSLSGPFLHYQMQGHLFFLILESCTLPTSHEKMTLFPLNFYDLFVSGMLNFMMKCLVSWGTSLDSSNYRFIFFNSEKISSIISFIASSPLFFC